jgi:acyl-CoA thioester hydrolase
MAATIESGLRTVETARATIHAWQCDHMGHANIRAYCEIFEQALWHLFCAVALTPSVLRAGSLHIAGVRQNTSYRKELYPGDCVAVSSNFSDLQAKRRTMRHEMVNIETKALVAICEFTAVCISSQTRRPTELPADILAQARALVRSA